MLRFLSAGFGVLTDLVGNDAQELVALRGICRAQGQHYPPFNAGIRSDEKAQEFPSSKPFRLHDFELSDLTPGPKSGEIDNPLFKEPYFWRGTRRAP